jgi:3-deoxy-D-manno-octulosonic-acid transferase
MHPPSPSAASGAPPMTVGARISRRSIPKFDMYRNFSKKENNYTTPILKNAFFLAE